MVESAATFGRSGLRAHGGLLSGSGPHMKGQTLSVPQHNDAHGLANLHGVQRISVVVDIGDLLAPNSTTDEACQTVERTGFPRDAIKARVGSQPSPRGKSIFRCRWNNAASVKEGDQSTRCAENATRQSLLATLQSVHRQYLEARVRIGRLKRRF